MPKCFLLVFLVRNCATSIKKMLYKNTNQKEQFYPKNRNAENDENRDYDSFIDLCAEYVYLYCCFNLMSII